MRKFTKMMLTLALLVGAVGGVNSVKAEKKNLTFSTADYCAASWNSSTNTLTWGSGGWNSAWTFMTANDINGDLSSWTLLHLNAKNFTNSSAEELTVVFKKNDGSNPPSGPTKEFVVSPDANGDINIDLTNVEWGDCDITNIQDLTIYGGARVDNTIDASVVITDAYLEKPDQEDEERVYATFENPTGIDWDADNMTFSWSSQYGNQLHNIGLPSGNLTSYEKLVIDCQILSGDGYRFMFYATNKGTTAGGTTIITDSGKHEYKLSDFNMDTDYLTKCSEICLSGYNGSGSVKVNSVYLVKAKDPLAGPKSVLMEVITAAKLVNSFAKTSESFAALTTAITNGETEYANAEATAESLAAAATAINDAIAGLVLKDGYVKLTTDMYHEWTGIGDDATIKGNGGCALNLNVDDGMLYGNVSVKWDQYAKIIDGKNLVILGTAGMSFGARTDRKEVGVDGGDANGGGLTTLNIALDEDGIGICDISDKAKLRINAIKRSSGSGIVTDLLVEFKPRTVTVGTAGYTTFSPDLNVRATGVTAYAAKYENGKLNLTAVTEVPAGAGIIIEAAEGSYDLPVIESADALDNDLLVSDGTVTGNGNIFALANGTQGVGFYKVANGQAVPAGKAYLNIAAEAREFIGFGGEATGIKMVENAAANNGEVFNLAGQRVAQPTKGLYIMNGKKVVIK